MVLRWYNAKLAKRPLLTQAVTTAILFATGDIIAQQAVDKKGVKNHEWARTGRMFGYGGVVFGPCAATWFRLLTRIKHRNPNVELLARVACDQGLFAPTFIGIFLSSMATMEGNSVSEKLRSAYWPALSANYMLWPAVQVVNFKFVPLQHRLMFVNVIAIGWNCYLSMVNSAAEGAGEKVKVKVEKKAGEVGEKVDEAAEELEKVVDEVKR